MEAIEQERIDKIKAMQQADAEWAEQRKIEDAADRAIFAPWAAWKAMKEAAEAAGERMIERQAVAPAKRSHTRLECQKLAPQYLKDALLKIDREIEHRQAAGMTDRTRDPWSPNPAFLQRPLTAFEEAAVVRAVKVRSELEKLYTVAEDLRPIVTKLFTTLASDDATAAAKELKAAVETATPKRLSPAGEVNIGEFVGPSTSSGRLLPAG